MINNKNFVEITKPFQQCWLSRYPWMEHCVHDNGGEFRGWEFQRLMKKRNINNMTTLTYNPTANSVCERIHQSMGNILRALLHGHQSPRNLTRMYDLINEALSIYQHTLQTSAHTTFRSSPGGLDFNRDMFLNIPLLTDWPSITTKQEHAINENLLKTHESKILMPLLYGRQ